MEHKSQTMKLKTAIALLGIGSLILAFTPVTDIETLNIDTKASKIEWFAEKVTGKHNGIVGLKSGQLEMKGDKLTGGNFVADMKSITVTDLQGEYKEKLEGHLKSEDFFGVEKHPMAKLVISEVAYVKESASGFNTEITGNLTIKDETHPITFPARVKMEGGNLAAYAELKIDRSKYNVRYGSPSFFNDLGDKAIYDEFTLKVSLGGSK